MKKSVKMLNEKSRTFLLFNFNAYSSPLFLILGVLGGTLAPAAPDGGEPSNTPGICQSYDSDYSPAVSAPVAWGRGAEKSGPLGRSRPQAGGAEPAARPERPTDRGTREGRTRAGPSWGDPPRLRRRRAGREPAVVRRVGHGTTRSSPRATGGPSAGAVRAAHRA